MRTAFAVVLASLVLIPCAYAQAPRPAFEVVSIREHNDNTPGPPIWTPQRSGDRVILRNARLESLIDYAWHIDNLFQVSFPDNTPLEWYDVEAKTAGVPDEDQVRLMFRTLLEDRCKMKSHFELREIPQYNLTVSKAGKLKAPDPDFVPKVDGISMPFRPGTVNLPRGHEGLHLVGRNAPVSELISTLSKVLRAPIQDMTGIAGNFDFDVIVENDPQDPSSTALLIEAVQRELGLKLEKTKAPMNVLVVDRIEKPTPN
jgi:uncharacterized protein (TIGR03435 family)